MSRRYGERDFDDGREDEREYDAGGRGVEDYGASARREREADYGNPARGDAKGRDYDYGRDYGYGRDYAARDLSPRDYETRDYDRREYDARDYGQREAAPRDYDSREYRAREYGRRVLEEGGYSPRGREPEDYSNERGGEYRADYRAERGRDYERGREHRRGREPERGGVRSFDTDYGRTTSRFYGRSGYEFGRDDYDRPNYGPEVTEYQSRHGAHEGRRHDRAERDERDERGRGWWDRAADGLLSWFGDEDAARRLRGEGGRHGDDERERMRARGGAGLYRGRGPKNYRRPDERIREEINDRLTDNDWLDASDVDVNVVSGEVTLTGTVDSRYSKRLAEDIAESVAGVANVQNNLRVQNYQTGTPAAAPPSGDAAAAARDSALPPSSSPSRDTLMTSRDATRTTGEPTLSDARDDDADGSGGTSSARATGAGGLG